jgi:hypothetical protein
MTAKFKVVDLPPETTSGTALITQCAADVTPEPVEWLWPGRVALGKLTLIAGEAGLGKSQLSIAIAAAVTTGGDWPCREGRAPQGNVVILSAEDGAADTVVPRLMAAGADRERVQLVSAVRDEKSRRSVFLGGVIRSIAWKWKSKSDLPSEEIDTGDEGAGERGTLAKIDVMKIIALFEDDPVTQKIVMAMMDGARGEELEQLSGLNSTEYESKRKKIRRRIEKLEVGSDE